MPTINAKDLGLSPQEAKMMFSGLTRTQAVSKIAQLQEEQKLRKQSEATSSIINEMSQNGVPSEEVTKAITATKDLDQTTRESVLKSYIANKQKSDQSMNSIFGDKINKIEGLKDNEYKDLAVGTGFFSRGDVTLGSPITSVKNLFNKGKNDFIGTVEQLTKQETIDKIGEARKAGVTFGALSDAELDLLLQTASKISGWAIKDDKGKVIGYDIGEEFFNKELSELQRLAQKAMAPAPASGGELSNFVKNQGGGGNNDPLGLGI